MKKQNTGALRAVIGTQAQEIKALRAALSEWEVSDIGQLRKQVTELEARNVRQQERCDDLQVMVAALTGSCILIGTGLIGILADRVTEYVARLPTLVDENLRREIRSRLNEHQAQIVEAVIQLDTTALKAFEAEFKRIGEYVDTLPPLQRAVFEALKQLTKRNELGSVLLDYIQRDELFAPLLKFPYLKERLNLVGTLLDVSSNAWPLVATNAFVPLLRFMGVDEAAQAAGEILDILEQNEKVPRRLVPKIKADLVRMGAIQEQTKLDTIAEYLVVGYRLERLGLSPEQAEYKAIDASVSHLKRAQKTYRAAVELYNRTSENTPNEFMEMLENMATEFGEAMQEAIQKIPQEQLEEALNTISV